MRAGISQIKAIIRVIINQKNTAKIICSLQLVLPSPLENADYHLGKLSNYLRLLGFDTWYRSHCDDQELARISDSEQRILLTRDRGLLKRSIVTYGYWVRSIEPIQQTQEILHQFALKSKIQPFSRCLKCNGHIVSVGLEKICEQLPIKTRQHYDEFYLCQKCQQVYWKGSHYPKLQHLVKQFSN